jgi:radical SAM family uncharacterized protein/radical SAM-linked protein
MRDMDIKDYLGLVKRPSRYIGGEINSVKKDLKRVALKFGLGFPDAYEVGMSHLGMQILYQTLNEREDVACERVFAPWRDMEGLLREKGARLETLESGIPLDELDVMGFSLQYELSYTNVLNMLELGGIPIYSKDRSAKDPVVIGGGPIAFNPEPVADFFDAFLLGDGEEAVLDIADKVIDAKKKGLKRGDLLKGIAGVQGVYVPGLFDVSYKEDSTIREIRPVVPGYREIRKRTIPDMDRLPITPRPVVPFIETVHDRCVVEISRGCTRGCRFCQAGMIYRPLRDRSPERIFAIIDETLKNTGYDEVSLLSLSAGDYGPIEDLLIGLMKRFRKDNIAVSLPSLRVGTLSQRLAEEIRKVRKTGFTLAVEAGSPRLRCLINKGIKEEDLLRSIEDIFSLGWRSVKLYFMLGLPTETMEDVVETADLIERIKRIARSSSRGFAPEITVSASTFIPKPHTPFQWAPHIGIGEAQKRQEALGKRIRAMGLDFKWHDAEMSLLEAVFSRGDRRLSAAILRAFKKGARFDGWGDEFRFSLWQEAFKEQGLEMDFYALRQRPHDEVFPWEHLNTGSPKAFLHDELEKAMTLAETQDCRTGRCSSCGICDFKTIRNRVRGPLDSDSGPAHPANDAGGAEPPLTERLRLRFSKTSSMRFLSRLELGRVMQRAMKRAGLHLRYSSGFHPMPRLSFSSALPVGLESIDEYMDIELIAGRGLDPEDVMRRLNQTLPIGINILSSVRIPLKLPMPSAKIIEYRVFLNAIKHMNIGPKGLDIEPERIEGFLRDFLCMASKTIEIERGGRTRSVDLKAACPEIGLTKDLELSLKISEGFGVRPEHILREVFGMPKELSSLVPVLKTKALL